MKAVTWQGPEKYPSTQFQTQSYNGRMTRSLRSHQLPYAAPIFISTKFLARS